MLVLAVQTLAQLTQNDSFNTLLESCPTRIFLPNPAASSHAVADFYRACNLNYKQIQRIAESHPCSRTRVEAGRILVGIAGEAALSAASRARMLGDPLARALWRQAEQRS